MACLNDALLDLLLAAAQIARAEAHILAYGFLEQLMLGILEHQSDAAANLAQVGIFIAYVHAIDDHAAVIGLHKAVQVLHQRRLARTGMADKSHEFAVTNGQRYVVQRLGFKRAAGHVYMV